MPYICCALELSSRDTFMLICFNLEARFGVGCQRRICCWKEARRQPVGSPPATSPCCSPQGLGPLSRPARLKDVSRGCLLPPVTMATSQPAAAALPALPEMSKGFLSQVEVVGSSRRGPRPGEVLATGSAKPVTSPRASGRIQGSVQTRLCQNDLRNVPRH